VRKTRYQMHKSIDPDYYGFRDEEDGLLAKVEAEAEQHLKARVSCPRTRAGRPAFWRLAGLQAARRGRPRPARAPQAAGQAGQPWWQAGSGTVGARHIEQ
jgi:hypothetical protein